MEINCIACSRYRNLKIEYLAKSPFEKWNTIRKINIFLLRLYGTHFMAPNFKLGLTSLMPIFLELHYTSLVIYTIIYYRHDPMTALAPTPALGLTIPVLYYNFTFIRKNFGYFFNLNSNISSKNTRVSAIIFIHSRNGSI